MINKKINKKMLSGMYILSLFGILWKLLYTFELLAQIQKHLNRKNMMMVMRWSNHCFNRFRNKKRIPFSADCSVAEWCIHSFWFYVSTIKIIYDVAREFFYAIKFLHTNDHVCQFACLPAIWRRTKKKSRKIYSESFTYFK